MQPLIVAQQVTQGVADFLRTAFPSTTPGFIGLLERFLERRDNIFKGPYLTVPLPFSPGPTQNKPAFAWLAEDFKPHAHQARAFERLAGESALSTLVATGTGSGKTECFLYPILEHCRQARAEGRPGIKAIILYPMNALATDQAGRVAKTIIKTAALAGVRAGLYVGDTPAEESNAVKQIDADTFTVITDRDALRANPPDILLTNYKMLDFLLLRAADVPLWAQQRPDTLRYLVVDELHTFDGAQGTDLACLIRRLKGRLGAAPGQLVCVGTSATLGDGGGDSLLNFARDIFGEAMDAHAVIGEDRVAVGDYLSDAVVEHTMSPQPTDEEHLDPANHSNVHAYLSEQAGLWFGEIASPDVVEDFDWRCELGRRLKSHFAFQNLLRDLDRLGPKSVPVDDLLALLRRRLPKRQSEAASDRFVLLWLSSLLALVAHARKPGHQDFFLQVKVEIWQRELRRMVAKVDAQPVLRHHDDLGKADKDHQHLPVIHCRDCHATGWGATLPKTSPNQLQQDLRLFYSAFFGEDVSTRFLFPATPAADRRVFSRKQVCPRCGTLHQMPQQGCSHCGHETLLAVDITANLKEATRNGAKFTKSHHDCPYCGGHRTLTIVGSQAASLAAVMVGQLFSSGFNQDKKLIAFSDSVQDAAHRAGFLAARTWRLNLRPALAQTIAAAAAAGKPLTLAQLPKAFEDHWRTALGDGHYVANFLPPQLHWMRDVEALMAQGQLPEGSQVPVQMAQVLPWIVNAEFGQDAHVGRTLVATGTACATPVNGALATAVAWLQARLGEQVDVLKEVTADEIAIFLRGLVGEMQRIGAWRDPMLAFYARVGCRPQAYKKNPSQEKMLSGPRPPRFLTLPEYQLCVSIERDESRVFTDWAFKALQELNLLTMGVDQVVREVYRLALDALAVAGLTANEQAQDKPEILVWGLEPAAFKVELGGRKWRCSTCHNEVLSGQAEDFGAQPCRRTGCKGDLLADGGWGDFYRKLYLTADIQRVVAHEHTGLLPRETRERVERDFKSDSDRPGGTNVLSATPTLEMGIDIGDLSSTLLCSVPPKQANYVQRAGRAGRSTGNALLMTMAASRPHDLYFWEEPREMMAGSVDAPGVFLNASAVLERQLTAFTLDCWVLEAGKSAGIPGEIRSVFSAIRGQAMSKFPYPWLNYGERHRGELLDRFVRLFNQADRNPLTEATQAWLSKFINGSKDEPGSLGWKIIDKLNGIAKDVDELKRQRERTAKEVEKLQALAVRGEEDEAELVRLMQERTALSRLIGSIEGKATLNVLTDEGLLAIHPDVGSIQIYAVEAPAPADAAGAPVVAEVAGGMFAALKDREIRRLGVPDDMLAAIRAVTSDNELEALERQLPDEAFEGLFMFAAGESYEKIVADQTAPESVDPGDFVAALDRDATKRHFVLLTDDSDLEALLAAPLERWRVFLHPSQRKLVEREWAGPVKVTGGAGTGKTVVAMHRAARLARQYVAMPGRPVVFTTFTKTLSDDIRQHLGLLCTPQELEKIQVVNLDQWASTLLRRFGYKPELLYDESTRRSYWQAAMSAMPASADLSQQFMRAEYERVVLPQGCETAEDYMRASRVGRGGQLGRATRKAIWPVFSEYRAQLHSANLREPEEAFRDARRLLEGQGGELGIRAMVVDEAQDISAAAFELIRAAVPSQANDLFIVGDAHQRIYRHKVVLSRVGVEVRGRSRNLKVNYRTTDEIRRWACAQLEGCEIDDLDGNIDSLRGYRSLTHGDPPDVIPSASQDQDLTNVKAILKQLTDDGIDLRQVCIAARTNDDVEALNENLMKAGVATLRLERATPDDPLVPGVRLATMHRIKGLEFGVVIIAAYKGASKYAEQFAHDEDAGVSDETETAERSLLHVAATRAKRNLFVLLRNDPI